MWGSSQPSCAMNAFPRIQHPKVRGGKGVTGTYQLLSTLACLKWEDQALKGQLFTFSTLVLHHPPTSLHRNDTQEKTEQAEQGWEGSNQSPVRPCPQPTAEPTDPGGGTTGQQLWVLRFGSSRGPAIQLPGCLSQL